MARAQIQHMLAIAIVLLLIASCTCKKVKRKEKPSSTPVSDTSNINELLARGDDFFARNDYEAAKRVYLEAFEIDDSSAQLLYRLAMTDELLGNDAEAITMYNKAVEQLTTLTASTPNLDKKDATHKLIAGIKERLGILLMRLGNLDQAIAHVEEGITFDPHSSKMHRLLGDFYAEYRAATGRNTVTRKDGTTVHPRQLAVELYKEALRMEPDSIETLNNLGRLYMEATQYMEAIEVFEKAISIQFHSRPFVNLVICKNRVCDWRDREANMARLKQIAATTPLDIPPFHSLEFNLTGSELRRVASAHAHHYYSLVAGAIQRGEFEPAVPAAEARKALRAPGERLRVGYLHGSGFHESTTTARLLRGFFGLHDRSKLEVFCYSCQRDDASATRRQIARDCEHFVDISGMSAVSAASVVRQHRVHILVDLTGYTLAARTDIMALRPAPIAVNFHGFPGTMGADYIDYIVTDKLTSPPAHSAYYTEALLWMPYSYLVNDHKQSRREVVERQAANPHAPDEATKAVAASYGVPLPSDSRFVFCSFNQLYKITPELFGHWMSILSRVPSAVLWLLDFAPTDHLRSEAARRGVDPARLVVTPMLPRDSELLVKAAACQLFLDSAGVFTAHTTAVDVLWAGIPLLTALPPPEAGFAARVAAGVLAAAGVADELVATDLQDYEERAVVLASNATRLAEITNKVRAHRLTHPLFDTKKWVKDWEIALDRMWDRFASGLPPANLDAGNTPWTSTQ